MLGFAIVGCGMIARFHARALAEVPGARARRPGQPQRRPAPQKMADELGLALRHLRPTWPRPWPGPTSTSSSSPRPAAPTWSRPSPPPRPASTSSSRSRWKSPLERCDRIIDACDRNGVKLCTIFPSRFADANRALKAAVDAGRFGRLTLGETTCKWWRPQSYYDEGGWKGTQALDGGGALMNQAIHNVDLLLWMMGPVDARQRLHRHAGPRAHRGGGHRRRLPALRQRRPRRHPGDDQRPSRACRRRSRSTATAARRSSSRTTCCAGTSRRRPPEDQAIKERFAQKVGASGGVEQPGGDLARRPRPAAGRFRRRRSRRAGKPLVDGREGRRAVEVILAIYRSAATGRIGGALTSRSSASGATALSRSAVGDRSKE